MGKLIVLLFLLAIVAFVVYKVFTMLTDALDARGRRPVPKREQPKAIDYSPENVVGWEDIQWTVEKRLPKEDR